MCCNIRYLIVASFEEKNGVAGFCEINNQGGAVRSITYDNIVVGAITAAARAAINTKR